MKVLHVINSLTSGGAENMLISFFSELSNKTDSEILLLVDDTIAFNLPKNIKYTILSNSKKRFSIKKAYQLYKYININNFTIVHSHLFPSQYYVAFVSFFLKNKIKCITTEHNTSNTRRTFWLTRKIDKIVYNRYHKIIFISKGVQNAFKKDFKNFNIISRGIIINNGISLERFKPIYKTNRFKIIMVARFSKQKDHITLFKAFKLLDARYTLSLVGEGPFLKEMKLFVINNNLEKRVFFYGFKKEIEKIYKQHGLFVLSSNWEGFGLVAIEAMASGLPVIASKVEGLREVVEGAGLLFEAGNEKDLAKKIIQVTTNQKLYNKLKSKGLKRANHYSIKTLVDKTIKLYNELI